MDKNEERTITEIGVKLSLSRSLSQGMGKQR